jgi:anthraniloyl-CoA monooxygenase
LTRSLRITHENLRVRDPAYVEHVDRWWMREQGIEGGGDSRAKVVPPMFTPFSVRGMELDNRVVVSPMCMYSAEDGTPNDWHLVHLGSRAIGGAGLVYTEMTDVSREGRISPGCAGLYAPEHVPAWRRIVDFVHERSRAKICVQLGHAGRKGSTQRLWEQPDAPLPDGNWELWGPSPVPWSELNAIPREMTVEDMKRVRDEHARAAKMAGLCGFDMLELHFAHGYLVSSFLTPLSNQRTDQYGGSLENRARFALEIVDAVREVWRDAPLSVRISATDWVSGGFDEPQAIALAGLLKQHGVDLIDVSAGQTSTEAKPVYGRAFQTPFSDRIRNAVGIATMAVGNISTYDDINTIVLAGRADLVALARAHLADPYFTLHAAREQGYDIEWPSQYRSAKSLRYLLK